MKPKLFNSISALLLCLFVCGGNGLAEIHQPGKLPADFLRAEIRAGNDVHDFDAIDQVGIQRRDRDDLPGGVGQALGHFPGHVELGAPDLNSDGAAMSQILSPAGKVCGDQGASSSQNSSDNHTSDANEGNQYSNLGRGEFIEMQVHWVMMLALAVFAGSVGLGFLVGFMIMRMFPATGPGKRESLANSASDLPAREAAIANALDPADAIDFSETADGWFKIAPYGTFRGKVPGRPQVVSLDNARAMEGEFNSLLGKLGRAFRGVPIYHGHPDVDPEIWPDDRRIGKITKLEARADGLWGFAEWNSMGLENKAEGWWIYPSPRWDAPKGQAGFSPDRLISIGLTNTPRILESDPVFNSLQTQDCKTQDTRKETNTDTTTFMDPKLIREKLGMPPEATDEEVMAKLDGVITAATTAETAAPELANAKTELEAEKKAKDEMACSVRQKDAEIINLREAHNNSLLDAAERETRITPADRTAWAAKLNGTHRETEINSLKALAPKMNTARLDLANRRADRESADDLREAVANAVSDLQEKRGLSYVDAWGTVKKDAKFSAYFNRTEG